MTLCIITGDWYPVKPVSYEVKNISLPRVVVDQLRVALRGIHKIDGRANTFERWVEREPSKSGCFEFEMGALHIAAKANDHLKHYRKDPAYWRNQINLQQTDYGLSLARRNIIRISMDSTTWYQMIATRTVATANRKSAMTRSIRTGLRRKSTLQTNRNFLSQVFSTRARL